MRKWGHDCKMFSCIFLFWVLRKCSVTLMIESDASTHLSHKSKMCDCLWKHFIFSSLSRKNTDWSVNLNSWIYFKIGSKDYKHKSWYIFLFLFFTLKWRIMFIYHQTMLHRKPKQSIFKNTSWHHTSAYNIYYLLLSVLPREQNGKIILSSEM